MNLDNLKPAWQKFRLVNSMQVIDKHEILFLLENHELKAISFKARVLTNVITFIVLILFCQGG